jgi:Na+-transporting methylmalonyl-CoA/oxaloacetate decarboxylase gamma subunit
MELTTKISVLDSLYVGVFGMSVVFVVLVGLSLLVLLQTNLAARVMKRKTVGTQEPAATTVTLAQEAAVEPEKLQLVNVDEKTAAMIMAIVCDEMDAQPEELYFKSIKAMEDTKA